MTKRKYTKEEIEAIREEIKTDYRNGMSILDISNKYDIANGFRVWELLKEENLTRDISEARLEKTKGWRKLVGVGKVKTTKIVSIPWKILDQIGFEKTDTIEGIWTIDTDADEPTLKLELRKRDSESETDEKTP